MQNMTKSLREQPADRELANIEAEVWRRIEADRDWAFFGRRWSSARAVGMTQLAFASAVMTLSVALTSAGIDARRQHDDELAVFSTEAPLAPYALLDRS